MVKRYKDWDKRLNDFLKERRGMSFEWGVNDCLHFAAAGVEALTGDNFAKDYPSYDTEKAAHELLENEGGVAKIITKHLGRSTRRLLTAQRGDVVIVRVPQPVAGLVDDSGRYAVCATSEGLRRYPLERAWRLWKY